jgi:dephospho-CoA kinase
VGRALGARGAAVIDTDQVAREVVAPGSAGARAVLDHFGPGVGAAGGAIDRAALAAIVFADPAERAALEAITHPLVHQEVLRRVAALGDEMPGDGVVVVEIPLLDARNRDLYSFDVVVLLEVRPDVALGRAVGRGMSLDDARARMAAQPTAAERRRVADRTIANDGTRAELDAAVDDLWEWLLRQSSGA